MYRNLTKLLRKFSEKFDFRKTKLPEKSRKSFHGTQLIFIKFFSTKKNYPSFWIATLHKKKKTVSIASIPNFFDTCHHTANSISHHSHTIFKRAELMSKTYKNGLFKKKKNPYKSPKIYIFEKIRTKIRTCTDKSIRVGTLMMSKRFQNGISQEKKKIRQSSLVSFHSFCNLKYSLQKIFF